MLWQALMVLGTLNAVQSATFRVYNGTIDNYTEVALDDPESLLPYIDKTKNTTFCVPGVTNHPTGPAVVSMVTGYLERGDTIVILINWEKEANVLPGPGAYLPAVPLAKTVAETAGETVVKLIEKGVLPSRVRCVGHSLGSHLCGWMGEKIYKTNLSYLILSIWGLDPAGPGFEGKLFSFDGLNPTQALYVNTVITNPGKYGSRKAFGRINFWVNCGMDLQPGCPKGIYPSLSDEDVCSHFRAFVIFKEDLLNPGSFPAIAASSCDQWKNQTATNGNINYLGEEYDPNKPGNFYLSTNAQAPFSKGQGGILPN